MPYNQLLIIYVVFCGVGIDFAFDTNKVEEGDPFIVIYRRGNNFMYKKKNETSINYDF